MGKRLLKSALFFIIFAGSLYGCARNYTLDCTRLEPDHVDCTRSAQLFGLSLGEDNLDGLVHADVVSCRGYEGDTGYLVELQIEWGKKVPLVPEPGCYSGIGIRQGRLNTANEINRYLENPARKTLTLTTGIPFLNLIFLGVIIYGGIMFLKEAPQEE